MPWAQRRRPSGPRPVRDGPLEPRGRHDANAASRKTVARPSAPQAQKGGARRSGLLWLVPGPMYGATAVARVPRYEAAGGQPNWRLAATLTGRLSMRMSAAGEKRQTSTEYEGRS
jgi:hypothetical protein